jgi:PPP family 3-phenylpropionic acid transporter
MRVDTAFLRRRDTLIFLGSAFLMLVSHGAYYAFFSIHLEKLGYGKTFIGTAWALASVAEILVMLNSDRIFRRFSLENILLFSLIAAVLRWAVLYQARSSGVILASQALHAMTYAAFHIAGILYVDHLTPDGSKTLGQAVNNAVTYGLGMMVGFFLSGWFYDTLGAFPLFLVSALIAGAGGALFMGIWVPARRAAPPER